MSTTTTGTNMSLSGLSAVIADLPASISYPTAAPAAPSSSAARTTVAHPPAPALGPSSDTGRFPPFSATNPLYSAVPAPIFPFVEQRDPSIDELMERASSPLVTFSNPAILPGTAAAGPCASPTQGRLQTQANPLPTFGPQLSPVLIPRLSASPTPGSRPSSVPLKVEHADDCHATLFSADDLADGTSTVVLPSTPSSESSESLYTDSNCTPPPDEVSGMIQGLNRCELFEIVHPETLREWEAVSGPKVIVFITNDTVTKEIHHCVTLIRRALNVICSDVDPVIGSAAVSGDADLTRQPVFPFLIHQIPKLLARRLILQHHWTVHGFSFFALPFALPVTSYAMTLVGLHLPARQESNDIVATLVRRWLRNSHSVNSFIQDHHDNLPTFMSVDEQIEFTFGTVEITHVKLGNEDDSAVAFNTYIHPPTSDPFHHQSWLQTLQAIVYYADCGTGNAVPIFRCNVCKGRDHSSVSCSFPVNTSFKTGGGTQEGSMPVANSGNNKYEVGERGLIVNGINFNYFMR